RYQAAYFLILLYLRSASILPFAIANGRREALTSINCDMGEAYGLYRMGDDEGLMPLITIANVACGFHASDFNHMHETVRLAKRLGVAVGAHPSLPDLQGFGRREMAMSREELANCLVYQIGALTGFLAAEGMALSHVKPHGALYGMAARLEHAAHALCDAADVFGVPLYGMAGTLHETFYADLDYSAEGNLIITREHRAVDPEAAAARCVRAIREGKCAAIDGRDIAV